MTDAPKPGQYVRPGLCVTERPAGPSFNEMRQDIASWAYEAYEGVRERLDHSWPSSMLVTLQSIRGERNILERHESLHLELVLTGADSRVANCSLVFDVLDRTAEAIPAPNDLSSVFLPALRGMFLMLDGSITPTDREQLPPGFRLTIEWADERVERHVAMPAELPPPPQPAPNVAQEIEYALKQTTMQQTIQLVANDVWCGFPAFYKGGRARPPVILEDLTWNLLPDRPARAIGYKVRLGDCVLSFALTIEEQDSKTVGVFMDRIRILLQPVLWQALSAIVKGQDPVVEFQASAQETGAGPQEHAPMLDYKRKFDE